MENIDIFKHYQSMTSDAFTLAFKGEISQELVVCLGESLKQQLSSKDNRRKVIRRVFAVFVEMAQNIQRYSADKITLDGKEVGTGILSLQENKDFFAILSGNLIENENISHLTANCEKINSLDKDGLKKYYKETLKTPRTDDKAGGGIGLIEIARKSDTLLNFENYQINASHSFFALSVKVNKEVV